MQHEKYITWQPRGKRSGRCLPSQHQSGLVLVSRRRCALTPYADAATCLLLTCYLQLLRHATKWWFVSFFFVCASLSYKLKKVFNWKSSGVSHLFLFSKTLRKVSLEVVRSSPESIRRGGESVSKNWFETTTHVSLTGRRGSASPSATRGPHLCQTPRREHRGAR